MRRKRALYVNVVLDRPDGEAVRWETVIELKLEMNTRAARGERHNVFAVGQARENFVHASIHYGVPDAFARAAWQRTSSDRVKAIYECFEIRKDGGEKKKEEPEADLFS